ncbi:MAG: 4'-phosphopantetheinyl transferase superfamily protein [Bacteroidetes bacterium]|nr:MAG: 4'-phosphopantetheinyl transferase superfamily protein [Bacteroidota bacterium]
MPFIPLDSPIPDISLGLWKIEEDELYFLERIKLYENEWTRLSDILHPQKRLEWLSSRLCLKELLNIANHTRVESLNTVTGKPYLSNNSHYISYTHSDYYSAAIASTAGEVGIDIEYRKRRRNQRTRFLFLSEPELAAYDEAPTFEHFLLAWSAKETIYKIVGQGFGFKENIRLEMRRLEIGENGTFPAFVEKDDFQQQYEVHYVVHPDFILTYACSRL